MLENTDRDVIGMQSDQSADSEVFLNFNAMDVSSGAENQTSMMSSWGWLF